MNTMLSSSPALRGCRQDKSAFTLIELLVVIAIIAILAAILFPVFAQAREKARQITCLSNEKEIGLAITMYLQDYDGSYPQSNDLNYVQWYNWVYPYVKNGEAGGTYYYGKGGLWNCPSFPLTKANQGQGQNYGVNDSLFVNNYPGTGPGPQPYPTQNETVVSSPSETILLVEKGANGDNWSYEQFLVTQAWWATSVMTGGKYDANKDNSLCSYTVGNAACPNHAGINPDRDLKDGVSGAWEGPRTIRYRHQNSANVVFADGHAKAMPKGSVKWYKNVYVPGAYQACMHNAYYGWYSTNPY